MSRYETSRHVLQVTVVLRVARVADFLPVVIFVTKEQRSVVVAEAVHASLDIATSLVSPSLWRVVCRGSRALRGARNLPVELLRGELGLVTLPWRSSKVLCLA